MNSVLYISEEKVCNLLEWDGMFAATEACMKSVSEQEVNQSPRTFTRVSGTDNLLLTMPGYLKDENFGALGCKLVTAFPSNRHLEKPLPNILANIMLFDDTTGMLKAMVAGTEITKWRTAAASAVATKHIYLHYAQRRCDTLAILGAGEQGRIHAIAFYHFFNFSEIRIWNHHPAKAEALAAELNANVASGVFKAYSDNEQCVRGADVIVTATFASTPIVKLDWIKQGAHINAVGAGQSHHSELEEAIYKTADVFIDHWEGAKKELAGLEAIGVQFKGEVGQIITGELSFDNPNGITVFQSLGMAVEDCAAARLIYDRFVKQQEGSYVTTK